jgi:hypothetical protein
MRVSPSTLSAWSKCPQQWRLSKTLTSNVVWSYTAFGTVVHHALQTLEQYRDLDKALETFEWYWHPLHIAELTEPVTHWRDKESYGSLRIRGLEMIRNYWVKAEADKYQALGLEFPFEVPVPGTVDRVTGEPHTISGFIDKLAHRYVMKDRKRQLVLEVMDHKTGYQLRGLRHHIQGTAYAFASTQRPFWDPFEDQADELYETFLPAARHFTWVNLKEARFADGGYRVELDYQRLTLAVQQICDSIQYEIFPLSISGEWCPTCPHQAVCGGIGLPGLDEGAP